MSTGLACASVADDAELGLRLVAHGAVDRGWLLHGLDRDGVLRANWKRGDEARDLGHDQRGGGEGELDAARVFQDRGGHGHAGDKESNVGGVHQALVRHGPDADNGSHGRG